MLDRSFETIISMLGILKSGAGYMLIDPNLPDDRINYMICNSNAKLLITNSGLKNIDFKFKLNLDLIDFSNYCTENPLVESSNNDTLAIIYTSGSTGLPKGVQLIRKALFNLLLSFIKYLNIDTCDSFLSISAVSFDMFMVEIFLPLLSGKTLILSNEEEQKIPTLISDLIINHNVDFMVTTPSRLELFLLNDQSTKCLKGLKVIQLGGEALTPNLYTKLKRHTNAAISNGYGPTEATACCLNKLITTPNEINIGIPFCNTQIYILDTDMNLCPVGVVGEICIAGNGLSNGYINNSILTNTSFVNNPFGQGKLYKTGDLGRYLSNGDVDYIGRRDFQIKIRGLRVELSEIENQLLLITGIKSCAVIYKKDEDDAYIEAFFTSIKDINISEIRLILSKHLPLYMVPKYIIRLENLPITTNGKVDKKILEKYEFKIDSNESYVPPQNDVQKLFCDIWEDILHKKIGIDDNLFELGADSLMVIKFKIQLLSHNQDIKYSDIFKFKTIRSICDHIESNILSKDDFETYDFTNINRVLQKNTLGNIDIGFKPIRTSLDNNILLFGANGYVGIHILYEFIKQDSGSIYCVVRNKNDKSARERFIDTLHFYFGTELDNLIDKRIFIVKGDILENSFGISKNIFDEITNNVSIVINSAANVKHYGELQKFKKINIDFTKNITDYCIEYNKKFIHISTMSISGDGFLNKKVSSSKETFSESNLYINQNLENVYIRTKFEAEKYILENISSGLNAQIIRLGNITNRYSDGNFQINPESNAFLNRIKSFVKIGMLPNYLERARLEFTPVDYCSNAIVKILQSNLDDFSVFHIYNDNYISMKSLINVINQSGINMNFVNNESFKDTIKYLLLSENTKNLLSGIINDIDTDYNIIYNSSNILSSNFTKDILYSLGFEWPKIDKTYLEKYIKYMRKNKII